MTEIQTPVQVADEHIKPPVPEHIENVAVEEQTKTGETTKNEAATENQGPEIPKTCKAGVVINAGPNFTTAVEDVPVPEPGTFLSTPKSLSTF